MAGGWLWAQCITTSTTKTVHAKKLKKKWTKIRAACIDSFLGLVEWSKKEEREKRKMGGKRDLK